MIEGRSGRGCRPQWTTSHSCATCPGCGKAWGSARRNGPMLRGTSWRMRSSRRRGAPDSTGGGEGRGERVASTTCCVHLYFLVIIFLAQRPLWRCHSRLRGHLCAAAYLARPWCHSLSVMPFGVFCVTTPGHCAKHRPAQQRKTVVINHECAQQRHTMVITCHECSNTVARTPLSTTAQLSLQPQSSKKSIRS